MTRPRLLDLFCCAGGAAKGYQRAGFHVTGIDIKPQPRYCGDVFIQADALEYAAAHGHEYDAIHASPPCQAHSAMKTMHNARQHESLIEETRGVLMRIGIPYAIENVVGAPLDSPILLCGTAFGLGVGDAELRRHRLFESNISMLVPACQHGAGVIGIYGGHARNRRRTIGVYSEGARDSRRKFDKGHPDFSVQDARNAMGIDWMTIAELSQAIPPAYTEFIGRELLSCLQRPA